VRGTRRKLALALIAAVVACGSSESGEVAEPQAEEQAVVSEAAPEATPDTAPDAEARFRSIARLDEIWKGDLDGIAARGRLRVLVTFSRTNYFLEAGRPRGITYELVETFVKQLNKELGRRRRPIAPLYIPVSRDDMIGALAAGRGDIAAANLTITASRQAHVDFAAPLWSGTREVVVTGPGTPSLETLEDLSGVEVFVRPSSSHHETLVALNQRFTALGKAPVFIRPADEQFELEEILELVRNGTYTATVADDHMARFWAGAMDGLQVREDLVLQQDVDIAWALRKDMPELMAAVNEFTRKHNRGTLVGNVLYQRYLKNNPWVRNNRSERELEKLDEMVALFRKYGAQYDFDWMLVAAQAYQESGLDHSKRSRAGAVGVMQVLPTTAASRQVGIPDIDDLENNIHAGVKYLHFLAEHYFNDPEMDALNRGLFTFAAYNAGPTRIQRLRREAKQRGLDPNRWFESVEVVVAEQVGSEPVRYVSNIYKYYVAYKLEYQHLKRRQRLLEGAASGG
jgi:membrane-bound lytic murein transglycosylase MltF